MRAEWIGNLDRGDQGESGGLWEVAARDEFLPQIQSARIIHGENVHSSASNWCRSLHSEVLYRKMIIPAILPRVKKRYNHIRHRVNACEVWPFSQVAAMARESEVGEFVVAPVLFRDDVFNVMRQVTVLLPKQTVFAAVSCSVADEFTRFGGRHGRAFEVSLR